MAVTIVSGGTRGLGEAVARRIAGGPHANILLVGRSRARGERLAQELTEKGTPTAYLEADVATEQRPVVDHCVDRFGTIHNLVNIAARTTRATLFEDTPEHWDSTFGLNVRAPYFMIQAAARVMIEHGNHGSIVNIGSVAAYGGVPRLAAYAASKGALLTLTKNLAFGLLRHNIRVNLVNPGWMDTESEHWTQVHEDGQPENWLEAAEAVQPTGRLLKPWEVANVVAFCLSADAGMLTGAVIDVDQSVHGGGPQPVPRPEDIHPIAVEPRPGTHPDRPAVEVPR